MEVVIEEYHLEILLLQSPPLASASETTKCGLLCPLQRERASQAGYEIARSWHSLWPSAVHRIDPSFYSFACSRQKPVTSVMMRRIPKCRCFFFDERQQ